MRTKLESVSTNRKLSICCKNPDCGGLISPIRRRNNTSGHSEYCSRKCYYEWSPGMAETFQRIVLLKGAKSVDNPKEFMRNVLKETTARFTTWTAKASVLGVKRQTYVRWLHHFAIPLPQGK